jgi:hypothetical protein
MVKFLASEKRLKISRLPGPARRYTFQLVIVGLIACLIIILVGRIYPSDSAIGPRNLVNPIVSPFRSAWSFSPNRADF